MTFLEPLCHLTECRRFEDEREGNVLAEHIAQLIDQTQSNKGMAAQVKKVIRQTDMFQTEQLLPDRSDLFFKWRPRLHKIVSGFFG
ncbi:MAG: hypothetical protein M3N48_10600, partial [Verrucomicrobiota bacterium]|nr:hypothetical protein [Verrucomicrobiota bacterium]